MIERVSWDEYFMKVASLVSLRGTCPRRKVGAVLVSDLFLISSGYNGAVGGADHCDTVGCLMEDGHCVRAVHAEVNAIAQCAIRGVSSIHSTMYTTDFPCVSCSKAMVQAGVVEVVYMAEYPDDNSLPLLLSAKVLLRKAVMKVDGKMTFEEVVKKHVV